MSNRDLVIFALVAATVWFALLGHRDLAEPDEGRYAEIPREMVASGDWITPRNNGIKFFEKPVLQYWGTAVMFAAFGVSNATARLWIALVGFGGGLWVWFVGGRLYGRLAGFLAFIATVTSLLYVAFGHIITLDMSVSVFSAITVTSLVLAQTKRDDRAHARRWMLVAWAAMGLATLAKGLIGLVLPAGTVVIYSIWQRDWALWRHLHIGKGLLVYLAVTAPWFVLVEIANPGFARFFFIREHFLRYTTTIHNRDEPFWFFLPLLFFGLFPWSFVTLEQVIKPRFSWRAGRGFDGERVMWTFGVVVMVFFSLGHSKMTGYILPFFPVLALLAGRVLAERGATRADAWGVMGLAAVVTAGAFVGQYFIRASDVRVMSEIRPWMIGAGAMLVLSALAAFRARPGRPAWVAACGVCFLIAVQLLLWGYEAKTRTRSSRAVAEAIAPWVSADTPVFSVQNELPHSLPFYLRRTVTIVKIKGELAMGIDLEPDLWVPTLDDFAERWRNANAPVAVVGDDYYVQLLERNLPMRIIYEEPGKRAIIKP